MITTPFVYVYFYLIIDLISDPVVLNSSLINLRHDAVSQFSLQEGGRII